LRSVCCSVRLLLRACVPVLTLLVVLLTLDNHHGRYYFLLDRLRGAEETKKTRSSSWVDNKDHVPVMILQQAPAVSATPPHQKEDRIIYFLHLHKSGGTSMCLAAAQNLGEDRVNLVDNCNVQSDQRCCGGSDSLEAQQAFARTTRYRFVANERDLYEALDTQDYRYVVTLRNSRERYLSHFRHMDRETPRYRDPFSTWWTGQPDNWNVRKICGTRCSNVPKFQLTAQLFNYSLDRLDQFEDLLFVEDYSESYRRFAQRVGWAHASIPNGNQQGPIIQSSKNNNHTLLDDWDPLMSALDDALYEYAWAKYRGEQPPHPQVDTYFAEGPGRNCSTLCCTVRCSPYR